MKACQMGRLFQCQWTILLQFVTADHCDHIGLFFKDLQTNFLTKVAHIFGIFTANVKNCPFSEKTTATRYFWKLLKNWASFFQHLVTLFKIVPVINLFNSIFADQNFRTLSKLSKYSFSYAINLLV